MLTIVCVLWRGDFRERDYTHDHVKCLRRMCNRWLPHTPFNFICLTNDIDSHCDYVQLPLEHPDLLPGWWAKLELFTHPELMMGSDQQMLYLDLDSIICGPLDDLLVFPGDLIFAPPLGVPSTNPKITKGVVTRFQSSAILWRNNSFRLTLTEKYIKTAQRMFRGDQDYFGKVFDEGITWPSKWFIKLKDCWESGPPPETKIIFGHPKPLYNRRAEQAWIRKLEQ